MEHQKVTNPRENLSNGRDEALEIINWMQTWQKYNATDSRNRTEESEEAANTKRSKRQRD